ncbi:MAG: sensor histidine kinase [Planctomycetota bacterium]
MRTAIRLLLLFTLALGAVTAFAWHRAGKDRYAALEQEGTVLADVLRDAAVEASRTLELAEKNLADRLASVARRADLELTRTREPAREVLRRVIEEEHVGRIFLFDAGKKPVAAVRWPAAVGDDGTGPLGSVRRKEVLWRAAARTIEDVPARTGGVTVEGLRKNPFGTRDRFGVLYGRADGGTLLVRADADALAALERHFGLQPVVDRMVDLSAVVSIRFLGADGSPRVQGGPADAAAGGLPALRTQVPVRIGDEDYVVELGMSRALADRAVAASRRSILVGAILALCASLAAAALLLWRETVHRRQQTATRARRAEERRLAEMGALAGLVTHEINNPLNALRLGLRVLADSTAGKEQVRVLDTLRGEVDSMARTLDGYMGLARREARRPREVAPAILQDVCRRTAEEARRRGIGVVVDVQPGAPSACGDPIVLEQALGNVVRNAIQVSRRGGRVCLAWRRDADGAVRITVTDAGPGFPEGRGALLRLGGARREGGHGLGLPLARRFIESSGGRLVLGDAPEGGGRVSIRLPVFDSGKGADA